MSAVDHTMKSGMDYTDDTEKIPNQGYIETEDREEEQEYQREGHGKLKLDGDGLPLIPQPTDSPSDVSSLTQYSGSFPCSLIVARSVSF